MVKLRAIILTSFQETLHRRVLYLVLILSLIVIALLGSEMVYARMAEQAGETQVVINMAKQSFVRILETWDSAAFFLALFLGATAIPSELKSKTIVTVLARPVARWTYLLGRWIGVLLFLWAFLLFGIVGALLWGSFFHLQYGSLFWLGLVDLFVHATFFSGVSVGLSVVLPPAAAGALTFLLTILPTLVKSTMGHPFWLYRVPSFFAYYLAPARMQVDLIEDSFKKEMVDPKYVLYGQVLLENLLYAGAVLLIACVIFKRRELRLR
ncbi:MAG TPA: ABC transporter permease subunit [Chthoniobacterales bacterium]|nr:ABC transporter permease subunit [Chthoniobacterales bacterium]